MPQWAGWLLAIAVAILYFRWWAGADDPGPVRRDLHTEVEDVRQDIREIWTRCGSLEGYVDAMAKRIVDSDPFPGDFDPAVTAAKRWQEWRAEQSRRTEAK